MTNWEIRQANQADKVALAECIDRAYSDYKKSIDSLPDVSAGIAKDIDDNMVWVATIGRKVVGGMVLVAKPDHILLANVAVDPSVAGMGLGGEFLELAESESRKQSKFELRLRTHIDMPGNMKFYERRGWEETGRSGNKVLMAKATGHVSK